MVFDDELPRWEQIRTECSIVKWILFHLWMLHNCWKLPMVLWSALLSHSIVNFNGFALLGRLYLLFEFFYTKDTVSYLIEFPVNGCGWLLHGICIYWTYWRSLARQRHKPHCFESNCSASQCFVNVKWSKRMVLKKKTPRFFHIKQINTQFYRPSIDSKSICWTNPIAENTINHKH